MSDRRRRVRQRLREVPVLPTLLTAGNLACGVTAIFCAASSHLLLFEGALLIFAAMICDMFDGKVARLTGQTGQFGTELDSLADIVSFGVAPAMLVHRLVLGDQPTQIWGDGEQMIWMISIFYAVLTAIRLARYNTEHKSEDGKLEATNAFTGLPSPGAAALLCAWVLLYGWYLQKGHFEVSGMARMGISEHQLEVLVRGVLLLGTPLMALLMVSKISFPHIGNTLLGGGIGIRRFILVLVALGFLVMYPLYAFVLITTGYVAFGVISGVPHVISRWMHGHDLIEEDDDDEDAPSQTQPQASDSAASDPGLEADPARS